MIDIIITIMLSSIELIWAQNINFFIDEKMISHQDHMIIRPSTTATIHSILPCQ